MVVIRLNARGARWLLVLPALVVLLGAWFVVRWYVGNTVAEYAPGVDAGGIEMARLAVRWAPDDPLTHWRLGSLEEKVFSADNMAAAVHEYQSAVDLSPNDYRYWMELGRALEAGGDRESGEKALRRAVDLAPAYSQPRWRFGNLLLREGKVEEAFDQLGHAAEGDNELRLQIFDLAMRVFEGNIKEISRIACVSPAARLQFALYLVSVGKYDDAIGIWNTLSPADRVAQSALCKELRKTLIDQRHFHAALEVMRGIDPEASLPQPEQFWNGGFESSLSPAGANSFDWVVDSRPDVQIGIDSHAHSGKGSLRIVLKGPRTLTKIPLTQTVIVEPGAQYRFECFVRTEDLSSASTPFIVIQDPVDGANLGSTKPLATGTNDWQLVTVDFKTKPQHDGIAIGFIRAPCVEGQICPIFGTIWYDDFNLKRIATSGSPRGESESRKR